ncbi:DUF453-domain-containing protein [Gautieria morchelliformis]|nr:DUF453-domain-containing protein [Gautieria morchelliformis]
MSRRAFSFTQIPNPLPAAFLRGGTSKGIFINRKHLPPTRSDWSPVFLSIMGSPDREYGRQLNGMGGGVSSLSKIMVVGPPTSHEAASRVDAEYTFAQVGIHDTEIDYSGNCGNLSSMVGAFAVDEGICRPRINTAGSSLATVRLWNTNTNKEIHTTFPVTPDLKPSLDLQQVAIAGVPGKASRILLDFVDPSGARTGRLLPTGNPVDHLSVSHEGSSAKYALSLVDATNPTVFISSEDLFASPYLPKDDVYTRADSKALLTNIESIRKAGAEAMGLDPSAQAQPKIAILGLPPDSQDSSPLADGHSVDICIQAMSMGVLHRAVPMTVGLCLGVAATISGTVPHRIIELARARRSPIMGPETQPQGLIRIKHPSGVVDVGAEFGQDGGVNSAKVVRTGRRLMHGAVWW